MSDIDNIYSAAYRTVGEAIAVRHKLEGQPWAAGLLLAISRLDAILWPTLPEPFRQAPDPIAEVDAHIARMKWRAST